MNTSATVTVHYERKVSDGAYGNEMAACTLVCDFDPRQEPGVGLEEIAEEARLLVRAAVRRQLMDSPEAAAQTAAETRTEREGRRARELARSRLLDAHRSLRSAQLRHEASLSELLAAEHAAEANAGDASFVTRVSSAHSRVERDDRLVTARLAAFNEAVGHAVVAGLDADALLKEEEATVEDSPF